MMKNWNRLFIRQGFMVQEESTNVFNCKKETDENMTFLLESLEKLSISYVLKQGILSVFSPAVSEEKWLQVVDFEFRGRSGNIWFHPGEEAPKVKELDTFISGMVCQLNRLGLHTTYCCDGHDQRMPLIDFAEWVDMECVSKILHVAGISRFTIRKRMVRINMPRQQLLDITEKLHQMQNHWLNEETAYIEKQLFLLNLEQCLSINGESGNEDGIRQWVKSNLKPHVDFLTVDRTGNILAQKVCGTGYGPTILLNAHLDTVEGFVEDREVIKEGAIWSSSEGILGADDRAGLAILLELAKRLDTIRFSGKVKFIFTVEEEVGLIGARNIDSYFLWDVDAAFVVDRRGTGDIVTSCGGYEPFCDENFGVLIEEIAKKQGLEGWKCTIGGSSDTRIWASHGIQSVNLSVGYQNEHTSVETLDSDVCFRTVELLTGVFQHARELNRVIQHIKNRNTRSHLVF